MGDVSRVGSAVQLQPAGAAVASQAVRQGQKDDFFGNEQTTENRQSHGSEVLASGAHVSNHRSN